MFVDSHCHLLMEDFDADRDHVLARAAAAGVSSLLVIAGHEEETLARTMELARRQGVYAAVGVHPHEAAQFAENAAAIRARLVSALAEPSVVAIGEIGLDYHYTFAPPGVQQRVFREQLRLAREIRRPVILHTREADEDTHRILREEQAEQVGGVFHCFTGDRDQARRALDLDFYISFSGILTFANAHALRQAAAIVPTDRLLIETDSPYLAPVPLRGKRNEPAYVVHVARALAALRGVAPEEIGRVAIQNFTRLFGPILA